MLRTGITTIKALFLSPTILITIILIMTTLLNLPIRSTSFVLQHHHHHHHHHGHHSKRIITKSSTYLFQFHQGYCRRHSHGGIHHRIHHRQWRYYHATSDNHINHKESSPSSSSSSSITSITSTSKKQKNHPILPISTIKEYIGQDRTIKTKPFTWDELQSIIEIKKDVSLLSRSIQIQSNYIHYTNEVKNDWIGINDCIVFTKFGDCMKSMILSPGEKKGEKEGDNGDDNDNGYDDGDGDGDSNDNDNNVADELIFTKLVCPITNKWKIKPSIEETRQQQQQQQQHNNIIILKKLLPNDFPYFIESNIQHWCLWKLNDIITDDDVRCAIDELKEMTYIEAATIELHEEEIQMQQQLKLQNDEESLNDTNNNKNKNTPYYYNKGKNEEEDDEDDEERLGNIIDTLSWINPKHLQSIPDIDHAHILCLRDKLS